MIDLAKKSRFILSERKFSLQPNEISFLKKVEKGLAPTAKQLHFFLTIQDKYQEYLTRNIRHHSDKMLEYVDKLEKYLDLQYKNVCSQELRRYMTR